MTPFRAALVCLAACLAGAAAPVTGEIVNLDTPGAFEIRAPDAAVTLRSEAHIEKQTRDGWVTVATNLVLVAQCPRHRDYPQRCVTIRPDAPLRPVPWVGMSCSGQCNEHCKKNEYLGPGTFRLVAFSCTGGATIHGPPFQLAAEPADRG